MDLGHLDYHTNPLDLINIIVHQPLKDHHNHLHCHHHHYTHQLWPISSSSSMSVCLSTSSSTYSSSVNFDHKNDWRRSPKYKWIGYERAAAGSGSLLRTEKSGEGIAHYRSWLGDICHSSKVEIKSYEEIIVGHQNLKWAKSSVQTLLDPMSADHHETILLKSTNWGWLTTLISTPAQYTQDSWSN